MNTIHGRTTAIGALAFSVGLALVPAAQAASLIDLPDPNGNTVQVNAGGDVVKPQFALWPLTGPNNSDIRYDGNEATGRGADAQPGPFGLVAGNIVQVSTGGNVVNPQVAFFTDNHSRITTYGNYATDNGTDNAGSVTGGQVLGHVVDANGNVFQLEFLQGNVVNPQFAFMGDNTSDIVTAGNIADGNGGNTTGALALVDSTGNVVQIVILSHNVINPQVSVGGSNDLTISSSSNVATNNGGTVMGIAGIFTITKVGNVTQIAILSGNVWAPQVVLPGPDGTGGTNTSDIVTDVNDAVADGSHVGVTGGSGGGSVEVGNIDQHAPFGNGNIDNPQFNFANHTAPAVVQTEPDPSPALVEKTVVEPETKPVEQPKPDLVRDSVMFVPGETGDVNGGDKKKQPTGTWKPGDGLKQVVDAVKNVLTPKPKEESTAPASDAPSDTAK